VMLALYVFDINTGGSSCGTNQNVVTTGNKAVVLSDADGVGRADGGDLDELDDDDMDF
jgi:hypothetical protein